MPLETSNRRGPSHHGSRHRLSKWVERSVSKASAHFRRPQPPPPLPATRPRPITPLGSISCHPQDQSAFLSRLPLEIRHIILLYAFGLSTIHVDLELDHPMHDRSKRHYSGSNPHAEFPFARDISRPKQWAWRSCVCHRNPPWTPPMHVWWRPFWKRPDGCLCMTGAGFACKAWLGKWPSKCRVGALGWLLSCRQRQAILNYMPELYFAKTR